MVIPRGRRRAWLVSSAGSCGGIEFGISCIRHSVQTRVNSRMKVLLFRCMYVCTIQLLLGRVNAKCGHLHMQSGRVHTEYHVST